MREEAWFTCQFTNSYALFVLSKKKRDRHWNRYRNDDESHLPRLFHPRADFDLRIRYRYALIKGTGWMEFFQIRSSSKLVGYCISFFFFFFFLSLEFGVRLSTIVFRVINATRITQSDGWSVCYLPVSSVCAMSLLFSIPWSFFFSQDKDKLFVSSFWKFEVRSSTMVNTELVSFFLNLWVSLDFSLIIRVERA